MPKPAVISALQASGESYDLVRETLKAVSVDASGKVELEDWVEVSSRRLPDFHMYSNRSISSLLRNLRSKSQAQCYPQDKAR